MPAERFARNALENNENLIELGLANFVIIRC